MAESANVSMDLLLSSLDGNNNISSVKKKLIDLDKGTSAPKFVNKVVSDRAERAVTYDATSKEVGRWQEFVTTNRHAPSLDMANDKRIVPSAHSLIKKFEPRTSLENEVQMILVKSNTHSDEAISKQEVDELGERNLSTEEIKERQAELGKVKSLLFYQQLKQHRVNKIKSKSYHRIKKRQRLRREEAGKDLALQSEDADAIQQVEDDEQYERVKERMNLKHKNTGKWAKMALVHGKHDKNLRAAYHESVRQGNDLLKKMTDAPDNRGEGSDYSDGGSDAEEREKSWSEEEEEGTSTSVVAAKKLAAALDTEGGALDAGKYRKIFEMDFMKKAVEQQREKAKVEAQNILKELRQMEMDEDEERAFDNGDQVAPGATAVGGMKEPDQAVLDKAARHIEGLLGSQSSTGMSMVGRGKKKSMLQNASAPAPTEALVSSASSSQPKVVVIKETPVVPKGGSRILRSEPAAKTKGTGSSSLGSAAVGSASTASLSAPVVQDTVIVAAVDKEQAKAPKQKLKPLVAQTSQDDLVDIAFAAPDLESEYHTHKMGVIDDELGIDEKRNAVINQVKSGWGDWAGPGNTGINPKTLEKRNKLIKVQEEAADAKRKQRSDIKNKQLSNVMLSDRRIKTASKYKIEDIPHPFTTREEYERSLQMPIGEEWNATNVVRQNTKPEIMMRAGRLIEPAKLEKKRTNTETSLSGGQAAKKQKR